MSLARMHGGSTPQIVGGANLIGQANLVGRATPRSLVGQMDMIGGDVMATVNGAIATIKAKLEEKTMGVPNYVFALAALAGLGYYGHKKHWFGGKKR